MSKNYMPEVAKMLGVQVGEEFDILDNEMSRLSCGPYKVMDDAVVDYVGRETKTLLCGLLTREYTIKKRPWIPKNGEKFWMVHPNGSIEGFLFDSRCLVDIAMLGIGNCFRTTEEALSNRCKMMDNFKRIVEGEPYE